VKDKKKVHDFRAKKVEFSCNELNDFRANPPAFEQAIKLDKETFEDKYTLKDKDGDTEIKFKGKVDGEFGSKKLKDAEGSMDFSARYIKGPNAGDRCESKTLDWTADEV
jgi:hypothetical protein